MDKQPLQGVVVIDGVRFENIAELKVGAEGGYSHRRTLSFSAAELPEGVDLAWMRARGDNPMKAVPCEVKLPGLEMRFNGFVSNLSRQMVTEPRARNRYWSEWYEVEITGMAQITDVTQKSLQDEFLRR